MAKFKVGDKVRILDGSKIENYTGKWSSIGGMDPYVGTIQTIKNINEIWTDGRVTKAVMYEGKQRVKVAISTCHPKDEFDFTKGAAIAFERLTGQKYGKHADAVYIDKPKKFDWDGFKAGKFNVVVNRDNIDRFLKKCEQHSINWANNKATKWNPIKKYDEAPDFIQTMLKAILDFDFTDKCDLKVTDGNLEYSFGLNIAEKTVTYD